MRSETCSQLELELSAYIDDELDRDERAVVEDHLATCVECRQQEAALRAVRRLVRIHPVEDIPDLAPAIMARLGETSSFGGWRERLRVGAVAAAAAALVVLGASLPFGDRPAEVAAASEITEQVRAAARNLDAYRATFSITERGWHPDVPVRNMTAEVDFDAPEMIKLRVTDETDYPSEQWPRNDVTLLATSKRWWIEEPSSCPAAALPDCAAPTTWAGVIERRVLVHRQPFDFSTGLPTDIVVPLETLAADDSFQVLERTLVAGRPAYRLALDYRQAVPLISALEAGGAWREFHPLDPVQLWVDAETWFPLRFTVRAGSSPDRSLWATRRTLDDSPGEVLLDVRATSFDEPRGFTPGTFDVPTTGLKRDGGFVPGLTSEPVAIAGLQPYLAGTTAEGDSVQTYVDGMSYLKIVDGPGRLSSIALQAGETVRLGGAGFGYYVPASMTAGRRLEMSNGVDAVRFQTNLPRAALIDIATSFGFHGRRAPRTIESSTGLSVRRSTPARAFDPFPFALRPSYLPEGYRAATATLARANDGTRSVTVYFRRGEAEFDGLGLRLVQSAPVDFLPPSSEEFVEVEIGDLLGRWSAERGELEWIDGEIYRAVSVPSADLYTAVQIAESLR